MFAEYSSLDQVRIEIYLNGSEGVLMDASNVSEAVEEAKVILRSASCPWGGLIFERTNENGDLKEFATGVADADGGFKILAVDPEESSEDFEERMDEEAALAEKMGRQALGKLAQH